MILVRLGAYHTINMLMNFAGGCKNGSAYRCIKPTLRCMTFKKILVHIGAYLRHGRVKRNGKFEQMLVRICA